jgi:hypothetical protein
MNQQLLGFAVQPSAAANAATAALAYAAAAADDDDDHPDHSDDGDADGGESVPCGQVVLCFH